MQVSFQDLQLSPALVSVVHDLGYTHPSPIQSEAIPALLSGQDVIGQSQTGSGKTAAFALPILQKIDIDRHELQALVLCPTRELTSQVGREMRKLGRDHHGLQVVELVGGQPTRPQREALERGAQIVIGTPGRLMDLMERRYLKPGTIKIVVLDEADRIARYGLWRCRARDHAFHAASPPDRAFLSHLPTCDRGNQPRNPARGDPDYDQGRGEGPR